MLCNTYMQFFKTVAEPSRVEILFMLRKQDLHVQDLVNKIKKEQSTISHNLRILKQKGFVESKINGKKRLYSLTKECQQLLESMDKHVKKYFHHDCKCGK